jgi:hypothetical protein
MEQVDQNQQVEREIYRSIAEFYPFYLSQHQDRTNRRLHFVGTSFVIGFAVAAVVTGNYWWLLALPVAGYGFAWVGHFAYERNKPATFKYPFYSLACDFLMYRDMLTGRIRF